MTKAGVLNERSTLVARVGRWVRHALPQGGRLPEHAWRVRHVGVLMLLWCQAALIPLYALARDFSPVHAVAEGLIVPLAGAAAMWPGFSPRIRTALASLGLLLSSAVFVHLSGGVIEMHFHFFVMVAVVALYQDWLPFLTAIGFVFLHHGVMGVLDADSVYNHFAAQNDPWLWAGVHSFFITGTSVACLITWRLNERALDERTMAEERLRRETRVVESLHEVGRSLSAELDSERVIQTVTDAATELSGAQFGAFFYNVVDDAGESYMLYSLSGASKDAFARFGLPRNTPIFAPTFAGEGVVRLDDVTSDPRYGQMAPHHGMPQGHLPVRSYLAVPVRSRGGEVLGGLFFGHSDAGRFSTVSQRIVEGIAAQAAIAIDNARLYESELVTRARAEAASRRLGVLAEASQILTSSLEVEVVLAALSDLVNTQISDYCVVHFIESDGSLRTLSSGDAPGVPEEGASASDPGPVRRALRSGRSQVLDVPEGQGTGRVIVVPLAGRTGVVGAISLGTRQGSARALRDDDLPFAEELARRAALAIENARLYARQRSVAETLQHSFLPEQLPELPGVATAARYMAGGPDVEVGGDWYDVIQLPSGQLGMAIGDVVGRGERAASLMGQLRNGLRAYALDGKDPVDVVSSLNRLLLDAGHDQMATIVYGVLDPEISVFRFVNAGHPPPLLVSHEQRARFLEVAGGMPLGASALARYEAAEVVLVDGETLLLYTDGLIEERSSSLDTGLNLLLQAAASGSRALEDICSRVVAELLPRGEGQDDVAILAVQLLTLDDRLELRLPAAPAVLGPLRATLRRWLAPVATEDETFQILLACGEACTNAIRHGASPGSSHFEIKADRTNGVAIAVRDHGRWRQPRPSAGGRGLDIIESCTDGVLISRSETGTEVRMHWQLAPGAQVEVVG